jgi:hypothetical protein
MGVLTNRLPRLPQATFSILALYASMTKYPGAVEGVVLVVVAAAG